MKYILQECTPEEVEAIAQWKAADKRHAKQLAHVEWLWQQSRRVAASSTVDEEAAWQHFKKLRHTPAALQIQPARSRQLRRGWLQAAAAVLVLLVAGYLVRLLIRPAAQAPAMLAVHATTHTLTDTLPDGSVVTLNRNSSLEKPEVFTGQERRVNLQGEAFFDVQPNQQKPFTITAGAAEISVLGTSFNVKADTASLEVIVETGVVQVNYAGKSRLVQAREKLLLNLADTSFELKTNINKLHQYYRTRVFVCDNTSLQDLLTVLANAYQTPITIERNEWKNLRLNATFNNESLDAILEIIAATLDIHYTKRGHAIVFE